MVCGRGLGILLSCCLALVSLSALSRDLQLPPDYKLVWADEFSIDGPPDPAKWGHDTQRNKLGWHNNELQYYSGPGQGNAQVQGGVLHIVARQQSMALAADWGGQAYTSARLTTLGQAQWTYGFFEVRAKMPCGKGTWPAIWLLGSKGAWPGDGELDIMEHRGHTPQQTSSAVHVSAGHAGQAVGGQAKVPDACDQFHRYQMLWTPTEVVFGVDDFAHLRFPKMLGGAQIWPFDAPQFVILNLAIGGDLGGPVDNAIFPVGLQVDYVRVFQRN